jgi:hypothetical protein
MNPSLLRIRAAQSLSSMCRHELMTATARLPDQLAAKMRDRLINCLGYCKSEMKNPVAEVVRGFWRVGKAPAEIERLNWEYGPNWRLPFRETIDY